MARKRRDNPAIRKFIVTNVEAHPGDIASFTTKEFGISRMTANRYLDRLVSDKTLEATGETKARKYKLRNFIDTFIRFDIAKNTEEHRIWRETIRPLLRDLPNNVVSILEYGTSEMLNNAIDHSESKIGVVYVVQNASYATISIRDYGVGIFNKIAKECQLSEPREAILELAKGKLTTDPQRHTGEGIFFTSRAVSQFAIFSGDLNYLHNKERGDDDWLIEDVRKDEGMIGSWVFLKMYANDTQTLEDVFSKYSSDDEGAGIFSRTHVPVALARYPNEQLVSRSQAKRVLARFNRFSEAILDFADVPTIGQAFADEIFRVFLRGHPEIKLLPIHANEQVQGMINRAMAASNGEGQGELFDQSTPPEDSTETRP